VCAHLVSLVLIVISTSTNVQVNLANTMVSVLIKLLNMSVIVAIRDTLVLTVKMLSTFVRTQLVKITVSVIQFLMVSSALVNQDSLALIVRLILMIVVEERAPTEAPASMVSTATFVDVIRAILDLIVK
jgi:hypothetical protein